MSKKSLFLFWGRLWDIFFHHEDPIVQSVFDISHHLVLWKPGRCSNVPAEILILWRPGVHLFGDSTCNTQLPPSSAWPWAELQGREKHKKSWKEKGVMSQEGDSNYFYRTLLGSLEKHAGFNNAHFKRSKVRDNWKSVIARVKCSSCLIA